MKDINIMHFVMNNYGRIMKIAKFIGVSDMTILQYVCIYIICIECIYIIYNVYMLYVHTMCAYFLNIISHVYSFCHLYLHTDIHICTVEEK